MDKVFLRFLAVGVLNTAFGYGCYVLALSLGLGYASALAVATVIGVLFNFHSTGRLVFGSRDNRLIFRFVAIYGVVYTANVAGIKLSFLLGLDAYTGGALLVLPMAVLAFLLNKRFVFGHG
jgi:putative flippase GtrA